MRTSAMITPVASPVGETLKPCPFCGSRDIATDGPSYTLFMCNNCGGQTYDQDSHAEAVAAWNRRPLGEAESGGEASLTVIDPDAWEPCSPSYLDRGGDCNAPRVWNAVDQNHWHPKLASPAPSAGRSSPAEPLQVTDEMVEAFCATRFGEAWNSEWAENRRSAERIRTRAALTAALSRGDE